MGQQKQESKQERRAFRTSRARPVDAGTSVRAARGPLGPGAGPSLSLCDKFSVDGIEQGSDDTQVGSAGSTALAGTTRTTPDTVSNPDNGPRLEDRRLEWLRASPARRSRRSSLMPQWSALKN